MTRSTSSGRQRSSKLSRLRNKLTLRSQTSAARRRRDNEDEEWADIQSTIQAQESHDVRNISGQHLQVKTKKLFQRASPMKLVRIYPSLTSDQEFLIRKYDYGGLLDIKCSKLQPELCQFIMDSFDPGTCSMVFPGRGSIPVTEVSVQEVLGVPLGFLDVVYGSDSYSIQFMKGELHNTGNKQPTIASLEQKLVRMKKANRKFLRFFIMYAMCSVLAPTTGVRISPRVFPSLVNIKQAKDLNICKFVIIILCKALSSEGKGDVTPCMIYLMVKYLDSLQLQGIDINKEGTRVSAWTNALIMKAIKQDRHADGSFGAAPLKPEFSNAAELAVADHEHGTDPSFEEEKEQSDVEAGEVKEERADDVHAEQEPAEEYHHGDSILFSDPQKIIKFIEKNTPKDRTPEDMERFRESIEYACHGFEASLQILLRNLATTSANKRSTARKRQVADSQGSEKEEGEATPAGVADAAKNESGTSSEGDKDFCCDDEDTEQTQTTISLDDEDVQLTDTQQEKFSTQDDRYIRRKKRAKMEDGGASKQQQGVQADRMVLEASEGGETLCQQPDKDAVLALPSQRTTPGGSISKATSLNNYTSPNQIDGTPEPKGVGETKDISEKCTAHVVKSAATVPAATPKDLEPSAEQGTAPGVKSAATVSTATTKDLGPSAEEGTAPTVKYEAKLRFTHLDSKKTEIIASLVRDLRAKQMATARNASKQVSEKENLPPDSRKILGVGSTAAKIDDKSASLLNSRDSSSHGGEESFDEETSDTSEETKRREFLAYVGSSPPGRKFNIPLLEEPTFLDMETARPAEKAFQSILRNLKPIDMEETNAGLESFFDENFRQKAENLLSEMEPKILPTKRKAVSFAGRQHKRLKTATTSAEPSPSRYRTRAVVRQEASNSPPKEVNTGDGAATVNKQPIPTDSGSRRMHSGFTTATPTTKDSELHTQNSQPKTMTVTVPTSAFNDSMNRQLNFDSSESDILRKKSREAAKKAADPPTFDLDTPPNANDEEQDNPGELRNEVPETVAAVQEGCSNANGNLTNIIPPVTHEYDKRVPRKGKFNKSPLLNTENAKSYTVSRNIDNLYNMVCEHGWKRNPGDPSNGKNAIDIESFYVDFGLLGDSVAPRCMLANSVAECAINIIREENTNQKKFIMPLRISRYLIDVRLELKDVTRCFNAQQALDQKDEICFPTLEKLPDQASKDPVGHYWLIVLNIKAERFEIIDSLAVNGEPLMMETCHHAIASIKVLWAREYKLSKVQIANWPIELIESPAQTNTYDCGFFMLKNLEERNGRKPATFTQKDLPNIRKLYTDKWLRANKTNVWKQYL